MPVIDMRSDTITRPTPGMMTAMMNAEVGDDVFGEDPTVNGLEKKVAGLFGMEGALYCTSGTMSNQIGIKTHTQPGDEVICEQEAHVYIYEGGGIAFNSGAQTRPLAGNRGRIDADQVRRAVNPDDAHKARTSLVCLENTSNRGGGSCYDLREIVAIRKVCDEQGLKLHLDGARLFNAIVATGEKPESFGTLFHSISVCFNKGLGCPAGSVLIGNAAFIRQARRYRKIFGGGLRQSGFYAATAIYALDNHLDRLAEDHSRAQQIGAVLAKKAFVKEVLPVETNLVIAELKPGYSPREIAAEWRAKNLLSIAISENKLRLVTHLDLTKKMTDEACRIIEHCC